MGPVTMDSVSSDRAIAARRIAGAGTPAALWRNDATLAAVVTVDVDQLVPPGCRAVLVAPHPDDEVLACGGLLQLLAARRESLLLVAVTDGEGSHPGSPAWPAARLRQVRPLESEAALSVLGARHAAIVRLGIADGGVSAEQASLERHLDGLIAPTDVLITTWRYDGHPDHEACARACLAAARRIGARALEVPVWGWHWSTPADRALPLARAKKLALSPAQLAGKRAAMDCFASQTAGDTSRSAGPVLPGSVLERLLTPHEIYFETAL